MRPRSGRTLGRRHRRGVAVLVVMLLIAVTLAVSYVSMRSQTMTLQVQSNALLRGSAREAAMTGMAVALKTMQTSTWSGVSTTLARSLGDGRRFEATYTTGDASLVSTDAAYAEYPYRVTVDVTGYAAEVGRPDRQISHRLRAIVRLVPRAVATQPTGWSDITGQTFCQWAEGTFSATVPFRMEGPVRIRTQIDLCGVYPEWSNEARAWYFSGLNSKRVAGQADWRPFTGPVKLPYSVQSSGIVSLLSSTLAVTTQDTSKTTSISWPAVSLPTGYRLYPGGKLYSVPTLPADLRNITLQPDPLTNPIGGFYRAGRVRVYENVTVQGTIFLSGTDGGLEVYGTNAKLKAMDLPGLQDPSSSTSVPVRLPTVFAQDDVGFFSGAQAQVTGLVVALDRFLVAEASQSYLTMALQGKVAARNVQISPRTEWDQLDWWWDWMFAAWYYQRTNSGGVAWFPDWMDSYGLTTQPTVTIKADSTNILYHWQNPNDPIYVPHADDATTLDPTHPGLRWDLLKWIDNPQT